MDVYKTDEEQVQAIKKWWKDNSSSILGSVLIVVASLSGYQYWNDHKRNEAQEASAIYSDILVNAEVQAKNTELLKSEYSATPYAALAGLLLAKNELANNNNAKAIEQLKWVIDNTNDDAVKHIATQRLARIHLSNNEVDLADALIKGVKAEGFDVSYSEIRGDINLAKNLLVQAKENYRIALSAMTQSDQRYAIIKMKLDDLAQAAINKAASEVNTK